VAFIPQVTDARYFFAVIVWGGLIHACASYWTLPILDWYQDAQLRHHTPYIVIWSILTLILAPLIVGVGGAWLIQLPKVDSALKLIGMDYVSRTPSAWNFATKSGSAWVRVHLKDGSIIGGVYEDNSFADDTDEKDLFLERVYNLTEAGNFDTVVQDTAGVWIPHDVISHVMFFRVGEEDNYGHQDSQTDTGGGSPTEA
jgi:hypothetical protein